MSAVSLRASRHAPFRRCPIKTGLKIGPRGDSRPRLSSRAQARRFWHEMLPSTTADLRSAGQPRAAVPTWPVIAPARARALAATLLLLLILAGCRQDMH